MVKATGQYVDPSVSRTKFDREIADYRTFEADYRTRGWFLVKAEWPVVIVVLASDKTKPPAIVGAVQFDYTNYDAEPPSVRFIDPFSGWVLPFKELPTPPAPRGSRTGIGLACSGRPQGSGHDGAGSDAG